MYLSFFSFFLSSNVKYFYVNLLDGRDLIYLLILLFTVMVLNIKSENNQRVTQALE